MKRRLISIMLILSVVFTLLPLHSFAVDTAQPSNTENPFTDVEQGSWCYDAVQYVRVNGLFNGTSETTFWPEGAMTRGMFVTVLGRMAGVDPDSYSGASDFIDVPADAYYAPYVAWAYKYGITDGTGDNGFSPDASIDRQQMATFFVRYFELLGVDYGTDASITTTPEDIDSVAPWAREAVLKLWRTGLLNGDGTGFNPTGSATRAQAATICYRADKAVGTWYSEPGVASTRVPLNPATGLPYDNDNKPTEPTEPTKPANGNGSGSGSSGSSDGPGGGTTTTTNYEVKFALGSGVDAAGVNLPATATYAADTPITRLPTPTGNRTFLGWYYDEAMTQPVGSAAQVTGNMTLYAKMDAPAPADATDREPLNVRDEPNYITKADASTDFVLKLSGDYEAGELTITDVSAGNAQMKFTVDADGTVHITGMTSEAGGDKQLTAWEAGHTYQAELAETSAAVFDYNGPQDPSVRVFNIITKKETVNNLKLDESMKFIPKAQVSNMSATMSGLFTLSMDSAGQGQTQQNNHTGTFSYSGKLNVGDTAAIYEGKDPRERELNDIDGEIVYVTITKKEGTNYTYRTADAENVLFTPDILPVSNGADKVPDDGNTLTVDANVFNFAGNSQLADMGLDAATTVDAGDFLALYDGADPTKATEVSYGLIKTVAAQSDTDLYVITYETVSEADVLASMDLYYTENREVSLTAEEIESIEKDMLEQAVDSGFAEAAAEYLVSLALETDGFRELSDGFELEDFSMTYSDGSPVNRMTLSRSWESGSRVNVTKKDIEPKVSIKKKLDHFDGSGISAELLMSLVIEVDIGNDNKVEITLQAVFNQEILINFNKSGGAVWKKAWIFPYIADYQMTANIDLGTYTGIGITATAKTADEGDEPFDWKNTSGTKAEEHILDIGKQITELMEKKDKFLNYDLIGGNDDDDDDGDDDDGIPIDGGLPEKYAAMIKNAEDSWIDIFRVTIFEKEGAVDQYHILAYKIGADFVVSANLYVTMGLTFDYAVAKRYSFSLSLFSQKCTNNVVDLETAHYEFAFYVMGTVGIRAGVEFELSIGLFSTKLDSIGICAEAGVYAQMWGYFYYQLSWEKGKDKESNYNGAMFIDIGAYLEISFKAQLFSNDKLTWKPTLFEKQWPFYSVGEQENVLDFFLDEDSEDLNIDLIEETSVTLPTSVLTMNYLDMKSGEMSGEKDDDGKLIPGKIFDDEAESRFNISFSDSEHFRYDPATNTVTVDPKGLGSVDTDMTITWLGCKLSFNSEPIERTVHITWISPTAQYITFNSNGGSRCNSLLGNVGDPLEWPADPVKTGYHFGGWYTDSAFTQRFAPVDAMPKFDSGEQGLALYAQWLPNTDTRYVVESYLQMVNGTYRRIDREKLEGTTDEVIIVTPKTGDYYDIPGYLSHFEPVYNTRTTIAPDGSTVLRVNYDRKNYTHTFTYGQFKDRPGNTDIVYSVPYEGTVYAPVLAQKGYLFQSYTGYTANQTSEGNGTYDSQWTERDDTPYRVVYYYQRAEGDGYLPSGSSAQNLYGTTNADINIESLKREMTGMTYKECKVNGQTTTSPAIAADGSTIVELYYDRTPVSVTWNVNAEAGAFADGGEASRTVRYGARITQPAVTNGLHRFEGWYTDAEYTLKLSADAVMGSTEAVTYYAKWGEEVLGDQYPINYTGLDGVSGYPDGYPAVYDTMRLPITLPTPSKSGYTFLGWTGTDLSDYTKEVTIPVGTTGPLAYTANWKKMDYTITYKVKDENGTWTELTGLSPAGFSAGERTPLPDAASINGADYGKSGYIVDGWYKDEDLSGKKVGAVGTSASGNKTYYGKWIKAPISVSYEVIGDSSYQTKEQIETLFTAKLPDELDAGSSYFSLSMPGMKDDYNICGWLYKDTNGKYKLLTGDNQIVVSDLADLAVSPANADGIHTLYLAFAKKEIESLEDLMHMSRISQLTDNAVRAKGSYTLMEDITFDNESMREWKPIPTYGGRSSSCETFDGQNHTITYNCTDDEFTDIPPLFRTLEQMVKVQNLKIKLPADPMPMRTYDDGTAHYWGAIAYFFSGNLSGTNDEYMIYNCHVSGGTLTYECPSGETAYIGGIVGSQSTETVRTKDCLVGDFITYTSGTPLNLNVTGDGTKYVGIILGRHEWQSYPTIIEYTMGEKFLWVGNDLVSLVGQRTTRPDLSSAGRDPYVKITGSGVSNLYINGSRYSSDNH